MSMKYKLLLCVVVLLACTATLFAGTKTIYTQNFQDDSAVKYSDWTFQGEWVVWDSSTKPGIPAKTGPVALVYNRNGDYGVSVSQTVVTKALPLAGGASAVSVQLQFARSLTIEDSKFDQFTVEISPDGTSWTQVYKNPTNSDGNADLLDPAWNTVSYDVSAVADKKASVFLRFRMATNNTNDHGGKLSTPIPNLHGPVIDDIKFLAADADVAYSPGALGTTWPAGFVADAGSIWAIGAAVAGGGQTRPVDPEDPTKGTETVGVDPGSNAAGAAGGNVIGTVIGGNYPEGMTVGGTPSAPQYLTWGPNNLLGMKNTALRFYQWLQVGQRIGNRGGDQASVQIHVTTPGDGGPMDPEVIKDDTTAVTLDKTTTKKVFAYTGGTTEHYDPFTVKFKYDTDGLGADEHARIQYTLDNSASDPTWVTFGGGDITTNTDDGTDSGVVAITFAAGAFASAGDYAKAQDNANFAVRVLLNQTSGEAPKSDSTAKITISEVLEKGVLWKYVWRNDATKETVKNTTDMAWGQVARDLSAFGADGNKNVWVRWSIGPTDSGFDTEYGGWSIDQPELIESARSWQSTGTTVPADLNWGAKGAVTVNAKNTGTATWDSNYKLYEVKGEDGTTANLGEPGKTLDVVTLALGPITRWAVGSIASGTVAADSSNAFKADVTAPPLSSVVYKNPADVSAPGDPALSVLNADWDLANESALGAQNWINTYRGGSIANAGITTSRFKDGGSTYWARYWTEELAGRVPFIVGGFGDGTYQPNNKMTRDQIAVFIARARGLDDNPASYPTPTFSDVPPTYWAYAWIEACKAAGIVGGYADHTYHPADPVDRQAMTKYITLGAQLAIVPAPTAADSAAQDAAVKAGWFKDVTIWNNPDTSADDRNVFRDYINTSKVNGIVGGYLQDKDKDGTFDPGDGDFYTYDPTAVLDRGMLSVFVWRAFMRDNASAVVLGGPSITKTTAVLEPAPYYGYTNAGSVFTNGPFKGGTTKVAPYSSRLVQQGEVDYAYITLDAERLAGVNLDSLLRNGSLDVTFQLRPSVGATGTAVPAQTVSISGATLATWISDVTDADASGEPYRNVSWMIPTDIHGDFDLLVSIESSPVGGATKTWSVMSQIDVDRFEDAGSFGSWTSGGLPAAPGPRLYPQGWLADNPGKDPDAGLFKGANSLELRDTQKLYRVWSTANRHNIRLGLRYAQSKLGSTQHMYVEWSKDFGSKGESATWTTVLDATGATAPVKMQDDPVYFPLPNGDPRDPDALVIGADDNVNFGVRLRANASGDARMYFDDVELRGT